MKRSRRRRTTTSNQYPQNQLIPKQVQSVVSCFWHSGMSSSSLTKWIRNFFFLSCNRNNWGRRRRFVMADYLFSFRQHWVLVVCLSCSPQLWLLLVGMVNLFKKIIISTLTRLLAAGPPDYVSVHQSMSQ